MPGETEAAVPRRGERAKLSASAPCCASTARQQGLTPHATLGLSCSPTRTHQPACAATSRGFSMLVLTHVLCASVLSVCVCVWYCLSAQVGGNRAEFYAYGLLHAASLGRGLLSQELCQLPRDILADPFISHALATVNAFRWVHSQRQCPVATRGGGRGHCSAAHARPACGFAAVCFRRARMRPGRLSGFGLTLSAGRHLSVCWHAVARTALMVVVATLCCTLPPCAVQDRAVHAVHAGLRRCHPHGSLPDGRSAAKNQGRWVTLGV